MCSPFRQLVLSPVTRTGRWPFFSSRESCLSAAWPGSLARNISRPTRRRSRRLRRQRKCRSKERPATPRYSCSSTRVGLALGSAVVSSVRRCPFLPLVAVAVGVGEGITEEPDAAVALGVGDGLAVGL